jgi:hypothetical protein
MNIKTPRTAAALAPILVSALVALSSRIELGKKTG